MKTSFASVPFIEVKSVIPYCQRCDMATEMSADKIPYGRKPRTIHGYIP